ncbi:DUF2815 family protein [Candidatus Pacearchaeota archaeon]|nr:DUF2815 family protein [Candidatus Pacearchaeota archaeon]
MKVLLKNVRIAFPKLFEAEAQNPGDKPRFGGGFIMTPDHEGIELLKEATKQVASEKWGAKAEATLKRIILANDHLLKDGDAKSQYEGYEGNFFINAGSPENKAPNIYGLNPKEGKLEKDTGLIYKGCYVNVSVDVWAQDNSNGTGINAALLGVQFNADGDEFGGGAAPSSEDEFEDLGDTGESVPQEFL